MTKQKQILKYKRRKKIKCNADKVIKYFDTNYPTIDIKYKVDSRNIGITFKCNGEVLLKTSHKGLHGNIVYWNLKLSHQNRILCLLQKYGIKISRDSLIYNDGIVAPKLIKKIREIENKLIRLRILKVSVKLKRKVINGEH